MIEPGSGSSDRPDGQGLLVAWALLDLADILRPGTTRANLAQRLVGHCLSLLPVDAVGIMLAAATAGGTRSRKRKADPPVELAAVSSDALRQVELFEISSNEGPCLHALRTGAPYVVEDFASPGPDWTSLGPYVTGAGFRAAHAIPMRHRGQTVGSVNLYHHLPRALSGPALHCAQALADATALSLLNHQALDAQRTRAEQLQQALNTRVVIEQAKGVLASHLGLTPDAAFHHLRTYARSHNLRLHTLAATVVDHPDVWPPPGV